jgi:hypothetical protein
MLAYEEALERARNHLYSLRSPVEYVYVLKDGKRWDIGWYFDYVLEPQRFIATGQQFGHPPGFLVKDDGEIEVVAWWDPRHKTQDSHE